MRSISELRRINSKYKSHNDYFSGKKRPEKLDLLLNPDKVAKYRDSKKKAMVVLPSKISASLSYFYLSWTNILSRDNAYLTSFGVGHKIYKK